MKKIIDIFRKKQTFYLVFALGGFLLGWLLFSHNDSSGGGEAKDTAHNHASEQKEAEVWTCSMHPQIRQDKPGKCPICAMDLIPLKKGGGGATDDAAVDPAAIQLSDEAVALANVQTTRVSRENAVKKIRLYGKIAPDERSLQSQTSYVGGRIEKLNVEFTGESVYAGQTLATLYSPELFTAQQELLEAARMQQPQLVQAAREKLRLWNLTDAQINFIQESGKASPMVDIKANTSGIVIAKRVNRGDYVQQGAVLFDIANLSRVWALFDAFEVDLPFLSKGDRVEFTLPSFPGKKFSGNISFIDPIVNPTTRTARVRVDVANSRQELKPEMYALAEVDAPLKGIKNQIVIPQTAILWTGKRAITYVRQTENSIPTFLLREIELGPSLGGAYVVMDGLEEGEEIVTNGVFAIDASAQLEGKRSMMNRESTQAMSGHEGHQMPGAEHKGHEKAPLANTVPVTFGVKGLCDMCKERIEKAAISVAGVQTAQWDRTKQMIRLQIDSKKTSADAVAKAIAKVGHDTDKFKADQKTYSALPPCCLYRDNKK